MVRGVSRRLLAVAVACAVLAAALSVYVQLHPIISQDVTLERAVQSANWGPLALTFPVFSWIGDAKGAAVEAAIFVVILLLNRRAWLVAAGSAVTAVWYVLLNHVILRPRPTPALVLQVTEHPSGSSFPSGHSMFVLTIVIVLMTCLGLRFLPRWAQVVAWVACALVVVANGISRVDVGAHWPTDVVGAVLVAGAWLALWLSPAPIRDRLRRTKVT